MAFRGVCLLRPDPDGRASVGPCPGSGEGCCDRAGRADAGQLVKRANPRKIQAKKGLAAVDLNPKPAMMTRRIIPTSVNKGREQP
jgi:hypothetical protein